MFNKISIAKLSRTHLHLTVSTVLLLTSLIAAFIDKTTAATIAFLAATGLYVFSSIDKIAEFSAGLSGIHARFREMKDSVKEVKKLAAIMAKYSLDASIYDVMLNNENDLIIRQQFKTKIIKLLAELKTPKEEIDDVLSVWNKFHLYYHIITLLNNGAPLIGDLTSFNDRMGELRDRAWKSGVELSEIKNFLVQINKYDDIKDFYDDYIHFTKHGEYRRVELWSNRQAWHLLSEDLPK